MGKELHTQYSKRDFVIYFPYFFPLILDKDATVSIPWPFALKEKAFGFQHSRNTDNLPISVIGKGALSDSFSGM